MKTSAIILAAGAARRFGRPKQLLEIDGETLVHRACRTALEAGCEPVVLVLGANAPLVIPAGIPGRVQVVENPDWQRGMGRSLAVGVGALADADADAVVVLLADQPGVTPMTLKRMMASASGADTSIVLCDHGDTLGPPALFTARHFSELAALDGDEGGRSVIRKHPGASVVVPASEARWDIDDESIWHQFNEASSNTLTSRTLENR